LQRNVDAHALGRIDFSTLLLRLGRALGGFVILAQLIDVEPSTIVDWTYGLQVPDDVHWAKLNAIALGRGVSVSHHAYLYVQQERKRGRRASGFITRPGAKKSHEG